jgi:hypothetical protein
LPLSADFRQSHLDPRTLLTYCNSAVLRKHCGFNAPAPKRTEQSFQPPPIVSFPCISVSQPESYISIVIIVLSHLRPTVFRSRCFGHINLLLTLLEHRTGCDACFPSIMRFINAFLRTKQADHIPRDWVQHFNSTDIWQIGKHE